MIRQITWSHAARFDLRRLQAWLEKCVAHKIISEAKRIVDTTTKLRHLPRLGKRLSKLDEGDEELRELLISPYVIRYLVDENFIRIVRLWHYRKNRFNFIQH